jgi:hypothetical protein
VKRLSLRQVVLKFRIKIHCCSKSVIKPEAAQASNKISENYCKEFYSMLPPFAILSNVIFILCFTPIFNALNSESKYRRQEKLKRTERKK